MNSFEVVTQSGIYNKVVDYAENGAQRGVYLGFPQIDANYTMALPGVTDWTGFPQSGKTQVLMEHLLFTSLEYGWKHLVYFPDVGTPTEIVCDLLHKVTGKTFDKRFPKQMISEAEIAKELPWVLHHFRILTKKDLKAKLSPVEFWDLCAKMNKEVEGGVQTGSIDSWKDMYHNEKEFGRTDQYLEHVLSYRNAMAEKHNQHYHTIIHPLKTQQDKDGNRKAPTPYDLKGGSEWYNNGKCMITVHRPSNSQNKVQIFYNKIKPRSVGKANTMAELSFDMTRFRYFWKDGKEKVFAEKKGRILNEEIKKPQQLEFNEDEDDLPF